MSHQDLEAIKRRLPEGGAPLVIGRYLMVFSEVSRRLQLHATVAGLYCHALGMVERTDAGRPLQSNSQHNRISVLIATQTCWKLSVFHQAAASLDRDIGSLGSGGFAATNATVLGQSLGGLWICRVRRGWQPDRVASNPVARSGLFGSPPEQAEEASQEAEITFQETRQEGQFAADVAYNHVARRYGLALGLANRSGRQQRTSPHARDVAGLAWGSIDRSRRRIRGLRIRQGGHRQWAGTAGANRLECSPAAKTGLGSGVPRDGLSLARPAGQKGPTADRSADGGCSKWQAPRLFGHKRMHQVATIRLPGDRTLSASLGHRSVLSPFASDAANYAATAPTTPTSKSNGPSLGGWVQTTKQGC